MASNLNVPICKYHQYGFCKFRDQCQKFHTVDTCDNFPCLDEKCMLRHPKNCQFYSSFGKCKFGNSCSYLHLTNLVVNHTILNNEVKSLTALIEQLERKNKELFEIYQSLSEDVTALKNDLKEKKRAPNIEGGDAGRCRREKVQL